MSLYDRKSDVAKHSDKPFGKKLVQIDAAEVSGEPGTGYEPPADRGEFECANCRYFDEDSVSCGQKTMMAVSKQPRLPNGRVVVHPEGCCEYVKRKRQ